MNLSLLEVYKKIWKYTPRIRRFQLLALVFLMVITSAFEVLSIGALIPFIGILTSPDKLDSFELLRRFVPINWSELDRSEVQIYITLVFSISILIASALRIFLTFCQVRLSHYLGVEFGVKVFSSILSLDYQEHTSSNTSELIVAVAKAQELIPYLLQPTLGIFSSGMIAISIFCSLLYMNAVLTLVSVLVFVMVYGILIKVFRKTLVRNSEVSSRERVRSMKILTEGFGGIRDIILDGSHHYFINIFRESTYKVQSANATMQILSSVPRFVLEAVGMVVIAVLAFISVNSGSNMMEVIPVFGVLALGAQKLLPLMQQIYAAVTSLLGNKVSVAEAVQRFDGDRIACFDVNAANVANDINFKGLIELRNVNFRFSKNSPWILKDFNFKICKGARIGIIGETGCGKSTVLDILMSLLRPQSGDLLIDNVRVNESNYRSWQSKISHVPQAIFLSDASIKENIAFGVNLADIDEDRVVKCAQVAKISKTIERMHEGYQTEVGERGVRLSGGQRQRLGIARAIYKRSSVIIFDEATSALDSETEKLVMDGIYAMDNSITIIMVAHRLSTLNGCDFIYEVDRGAIRPIE